MVMMTKNWKRHTDYLNSSAWMKMRRQRMNLDSHKCWCCGESATDIHFIFPDRVGRESLSDIISICQKCHRAIHDKIKSGISSNVAHRVQRGSYRSSEPAKIPQNHSRSLEKVERRKKSVAKKVFLRNGDLCMGCRYRTETVYCPYPEENWTANNCKPLCSLCQKPVIQMVGVGWDYRDAIRNWSKLQKFSPKTREQMMDHLLSQGPSGP